MGSDGKIFVRDHREMAGSALVRRLQAGGYVNIAMRTRDGLALIDQSAVRDILANDFYRVYRAEFIYKNLAAAANPIHGLVNLPQATTRGSRTPWVEGRGQRSCGSARRCALPRPGS